MANVPAIRMLGRMPWRRDPASLSETETIALPLYVVDCCALGVEYWILGVDC
jgi:hypothetical protein